MEISASSVTYCRWLELKERREPAATQSTRCRRSLAPSAGPWRAPTGPGCLSRRQPQAARSEIPLRAPGPRRRSLPGRAGLSPAPSQQAHSKNEQASATLDRGAIRAACRPDRVVTVGTRRQAPPWAARVFCDGLSLTSSGSRGARARGLPRMRRCQMFAGGSDVPPVDGGTRFPPAKRSVLKRRLYRRLCRRS